jgi:catechol 2,3-dioxygenase-like lactoylglutathione lyase family enzyme
MMSGSYVALATNSFDDASRFYGELLGFPVVAEWDRPNGRGRRFDLGGGLLLEVLDNAREPTPLSLHDASDRIHLVVEVTDIEAARTRLAVATPAPHPTSWGATLCQIRDPDGVLVTFLQWTNTDSQRPKPLEPKGNREP